MVLSTELMKRQFSFLHILATVAFHSKALKKQKRIAWFIKRTFYVTFLQVTVKNSKELSICEVISLSIAILLINTFFHLSHFLSTHFSFLRKV
jgi:hypothetical protein